MRSYGFVRGIALDLESDRKAEAETGLSDAEWVASQEAAFAELVASGRAPTFARITGALDDFDPDLDAMFAFALTPMLDGLARLIRRHAKTSRR